jgi:HEPN domain-containing protein
MTAEWVAKAEGDFATMERESRVTDRPNFEGICFHAQQCAEKYLKARLCEAGLAFGKVHDLVALLESVLKVEPSWETHRENLAYLSGFAVSGRYPGDSADRDCARDAQRRCRVFRAAARQSLELDA